MDLDECKVKIIYDDIHDNYVFRMEVFISMRIENENDGDKSDDKGENNSDEKNYLIRKPGVID